EAFAKDFGFKVRPCIAGRPRTKGKVETQMKFLDEIHAYQGQLTLEELYEFIEKLANRLNQSFHQGTGKIPMFALEKEKSSLRSEAFAKDFGFKVRPCIAGRPRTKGKVETQMKFLDEIHAYQGQLTLEELYEFIEKLANRLNQSFHQGTGKIPMFALEKEKSSL